MPPVCSPRAVFHSGLTRRTHRDVDASRIGPAESSTSATEEGLVSALVGLGDRGGSCDRHD